MTTSRRTPTTLAVYPLRPPAAIQCVRITPRKACPAPHPTVNLPAHGYGTVRNGSFLLLTPPSRPCRRKSTTTSRTHTHIRNKYNISSPNNSRTNHPGPNESPKNHPPKKTSTLPLSPSPTPQHLSLTTLRKTDNISASNPAAPRPRNTHAQRTWPATNAPCTASRSGSTVPGQGAREKAREPSLGVIICWSI